jgi:microcystin-dependent protein
MADRIIKGDSGNDTVIQNNSGSRKIEVTNSGDVEITGDVKTTTVKATNLKANDGTASLEVADSTGDIGFSGNTDLKIKLPSAGGIYESDGSTPVITETSGVVSIDNSVIGSVPAGMLGPFANNSIPSGWLACDGSAVSRSTYSVLYAVIGTTWGSGDGSSTFNLPDLEGAFLRGTGSHGTSNMADGNDFAGPSVGSYENDQFQNHGHQIRRAIATSTDVQLGLVESGTSGDSSTLWTSDTGSGSNAPSTINAYNATTNSYGTPRTGDETRPFNAGVKYCIKY